MHPCEFLFSTVMEVVPTSIVIFKGFNLIAVAVRLNGLRDFQKDRDQKIDLAPVISCSMTKMWEQWLWDLKGTSFTTNFSQGLEGENYKHVQESSSGSCW